MNERILEAMRDAESKAWEALSGYKFWMFGYHAARWVNYHRLLQTKHPSPFYEAVQLGRRKVDELQQQTLLLEGPEVASGQNGPDLSFVGQGDDE